MKKQTFKTLFASVALFTLALSACNNIVSPSEDHSGDKRYEIYQLAVASGATNLSYEEWLESIRGQDGKDGQDGQDGHSPVITIGDNGNWFIDGVDTGVKAQGQDGADGKDGQDGQDGENGLSAYEIYIKYHPDYTGTEEEWLESLKGNDGNPGTNGDDGKSAYEIYCAAHPEYLGDETQWLNDLVNGNLGTKEIHTVTFDSCGGTTVESQQVLHGEKAVKPNDPTKAGFIFVDWVDEHDDHWVFNGYSITSDIVLHAVWKEDTTVNLTIINKSALEAIFKVGSSRTIQYNQTNAVISEIIDRGELVVQSSNSTVASVGYWSIEALSAGTAIITFTYLGRLLETISVNVVERTINMVTEINTENEYMLGLRPASGNIGYASINMSGYYIASYSNASQAGKVRVSEDKTSTSDYKYIISITATVEDAEITKTIGSYKGNGHINIGFVEDKTSEYPFKTALFKFNDDYSFSTMIDGEEFWIGTYSTYSTFSYRNAQIIEYKAHLYQEGEPIPVTAVELNKSELALEVPASEKLQATVFPVNATESNVSWSSSDESVAVVNSQGLVTSVSKGEATITATAGGVSATCTVTVTGDKIDFGTKENPIDVNTAVNLLNELGANVLTPQKMWVKGIVSESAAENATYKNRVVWLQNNDGSVEKAFELYNAVIDTEAISGLPSTANALKGKEIVAEGWGKLYTNTSGSVGTPELTPINNADNPVVRVMQDPELKSISISVYSASLIPSETVQLTASALPSIISLDGLAWESSDPTVATVDANGVVTAVAAGSASITARIGDIISDACVVTVTAYRNTSIPEIMKEALRSQAAGDENSFEYQKVRFSGTVVGYSNKNLFMQKYDSVEDRYYSIPVYCGMSTPPNKYLVPGNVLEVSGVCVTSESNGFEITGVEGHFPVLESNAKENDVHILTKASENEDLTTILHTFEYTTSELNDALSSNLSLNSSFSLTGTLEVNYFRVSQDGKKFTIGFYDVDFYLYLTSSLFGYTTSEEWMGKTIQINKAILTSYKTTNGSKRYRLWILDSDDVVLVA